MALPLGHQLVVGGAIGRYVILVAIICVAASIVTTAVAITLLVGWDPDTTLPAGRFHLVAFTIATGVPAVVVPIMTYRRALLIRELSSTRNELHRLAHTDQLTGLLNRRGFDEVATRMIDTCRNRGGLVVAMMADLDHFKSVNDELGHDFGDAALQHMATVLWQHLSRHVTELNAVVGRQGGDEFAVLLIGLPSEDAVNIANRIRADIAGRPVVLGDRSRSLHASFGITRQSASRATLKSCMSVADAALFEAKRGGRNRIALGEAALKGHAAAYEIH